MKSKVISNTSKKLKMQKNNFKALVVAMLTAMFVDGCSTLPLTKVTSDVDNVLRVAVKAVCLVPEPTIVSATLMQVNTTIAPNTINVECKNENPLPNTPVVSSHTMSASELTIIKEAVDVFCIDPVLSKKPLDDLNNLIAPIILTINCN